MASASRSSHNSQRRTSSPLRSLATSFDTLSAHSRNTANFQQNGEWIEPPLRNPVPSFQDYPGITRHSVLEAMMPLGTHPTTKVKARAKGDPLRRVVQARNLGGLIVDEGRGTPEAGAVSDSTRAGSLRTEGRSLRGSPALDPALEIEAPESPSAQSSSSLRQSTHSSVAKDQKAQAQSTPPAHSPIKQTQETPVTRGASSFTHSPVPAGSPYFTAVALANRNGSPDVQPPLAFLYAAAEQDPELASLLESAAKDGTLNDHNSLLWHKIKKIKKAFRSQNSSPRSRAGSIAAARGVAGAESSRTETTRNSVSPSATHQQNTIANATSKETIHRPNNYPTALKIKLNVNPTTSSSETTTKNMPSSKQPSPLKESVEKPSSLSRRSSSSSLSSADSEVLNQPPPAMDVPSKSLKRSSAEVAANDTEDPEVEAARKRLRLSVTSHVSAQESDLRAAPSETAAKPTSLRSTTRQTTSRLRTYPPPEVLARDQQLNGDKTSVVTGKRSRDATPTALGRPPKKPKVAPRTKVSPVKNQQKAAVAGIARPESKRRGSVGNNEDESESSDNSDYCSACGGPGYLLCCDGCDRSFHFSCLDPPFNADAHFESSWFCPACEGQRGTGQKPRNGLFSDLQYHLETSNPRAFRLPEALRDFFRNIKAGTDGEFVEEQETRVIPSSNNRIGYDDAPNLKATQDSKGNAIICHACGKSSGGTRDIIPCDYCGLCWHLDCVDPIMSNPPNRGPLQHEKRRLAWMCPAHIDSDLGGIDLVRGTRRSHHLARKPKKPNVVRTHLRRGLTNKGLIEVESESSDDSGFDSEEDLDGTIYKLPRTGIKLDFIDKVKTNRRNEELRMRQEAVAKHSDAVKTMAQNTEKLSHDIDTRKFREQKAAFNLVQFHAANTDIKLAPGEVENLIMMLKAEAPSNVTALIVEAESAAMNTSGHHGSRGLPSPPTSTVPETSSVVPSGRQREVLLRMQAQISGLLEESTNGV